MLTLAEVSRLIDRIYAAGETGDGWSDCLGTICEALGATAAFLHYHDLTTSSVDIVEGRADPAATAAYQAHFYAVDPWIAKIPPRSVSVGRLVLGRDVLSDADMRRSEYYADFGRPFGVTRSLFGVTGRHGETVRSGISINRADHQAEFDDDALAFVSILMPHLGRAFEMRNRWAAVDHRQHVACDALDALPYGVMLVDCNAGVCLANTRASALLTRRDGIFTDNGQLRCTDGPTTRRLRQVCAEVAATQSDVPRHAGATLLVHRGHVPEPLQLLIAPVHARGPFWVPGHDVVAIIYVNDPSDAVVPDDALIRASYGLTAAESRVASLLATGRNLKETADELKYTRETTRWYVKQVLAKAGCRSQVEFASKASRSIGMLRPG